MISEKLWNKRGEISTLLGVIGVSFLLALVVATQQIRNTIIQQKSSAQTVSACTTYCVGKGADSGYCPITNSCSAGDEPSTYSCSKTSTCCCKYNPVPTSPPLPSPTPVGPSCSDTDNGQNYYQQGTITFCTVNSSGVKSCATLTDTCTLGSVNEYFCSGTSSNYYQFACPNGCTNGQCNGPTPTPTTIPTKIPTATFTPSPTPYIYAECLKACEGPGYDMGVCAPKGAACPAGTDTHPSYICSASVACCCSYFPTPTPTATPTPICTDPDGENNTSTNFVIAGTTTVKQWNGTAMQTVNYYDACTSAGLMTEYHCINNDIAYTTRACASGYSCNAGACKANPPTATPTATNTPIPTNTTVPTRTPTPTPICTDPDGENNTSTNFVVAGTTTVKQWNGTAMQTVNYYDACSSSTGWMTEYHCINGDIAYTNRACATGYTCSAGACKPNAATATPIPTATKVPSVTPTPTSVCVDPDGENNTSQSFVTAGTTTVTQWNGTAMQTVPYTDKCVTEGILENFCLNRDIAYYRGPCRPAGTTCVSGVCKATAATATPTLTNTPVPTKTPVPTLTPTKTPTPVGQTCTVSINTFSNIQTNSTSNVTSAFTVKTGYTAYSISYVIDTKNPATLVLSGSPYISKSSPYTMTLTAGSINGSARITARGTVTENATGAQFYCDANPVVVTIFAPTNTPIPTKTPTNTPTPSRTPTPNGTLTPLPSTTIIASITPKAPCARKKIGDADCKADTNNKWTSLIDFEIWRSEKFAGCRYDNATACGPDADGDGNPMDANFNYPGSGNLPDEQNAIVDMIDFNIWLLKGFNPENGIK